MLSITTRSTRTPPDLQKSSRQIGGQRAGRHAAGERQLERLALGRPDPDREHPLAAVLLEEDRVLAGAGRAGQRIVLGGRPVRLGGVGVPDQHVLDACLNHGHRLERVDELLGGGLDRPLERIEQVTQPLVQPLLPGELTLHLVEVAADGLDQADAVLVDNAEISSRRSPSRRSATMR